MAAKLPRDWYWIPAILVLAAAPFSAQQNPVFSPQALSFFETTFRPILKSNCQTCHNQRTRSSGLTLDTREDILTGGNRGPAVKPGAPGESRLIQAVEQKGELKMPLGGRLKDEQIAVLRQWIEQGVP